MTLTELRQAFDKKLRQFILLDMWHNINSYRTDPEWYAYDDITWESVCDYHPSATVTNALWEVVQAARLYNAMKTSGITGALFYKLSN